MGWHRPVFVVRFNLPGRGHSGVTCLIQGIGGLFHDFPQCFQMTVGETSRSCGDEYEDGRLWDVAPCSLATRGATAA